MPFLAAAEAKGIDLVQAAHLTVEQKLEGPCIIKWSMPRMVLQYGNQIIEKESLAIQLSKDSFGRSWG